jgi:hypothetical protein
MHFTDVMDIMKKVESEQVLDYNSTIIAPAGEGILIMKWRCIFEDVDAMTLRQGVAQMSLPMRTPNTIFAQHSLLAHTRESLSRARHAVIG